MTSTIDVVDQGRLLRFGFDDLMRYHGPAFPGGVAHGFTVMARALPLLSPGGPPERRQIRVDTAFPGPGARDAVELVTRAVTEERYVVDPALERPDRGTTLQRYVFRFGYLTRTVTLIIRAGFVTDEFIALSRQPSRTAAEESHLTVLKQQMADRLLAVPPDHVYDVADG
ncbi:MAG: hypothetical protein ACRDS0_01630 [Pseudonocardiaceae bacterium]